jgi:hypothetical protein
MFQPRKQLIIQLLERAEYEHMRGPHQAAICLLCDVECGLEPEGVNGEVPRNTREPRVTRRELAVPWAVLHRDAIDISRAES